MIVVLWFFLGGCLSPIQQICVFKYIDAVMNSVSIDDCPTEITALPGREHLQDDACAAQSKKTSQKTPSGAEWKPHQQNATCCLSFGNLISSGAAADKSVLMENMALSNNYYSSLWSCLWEEKKITFATEVLHLLLSQGYPFSNMSA